MVGRSKPFQNLSRFRIGVAKAAASDLVASSNDGTERFLALVVGEMGAEGVIVGVDFYPLAGVFLRIVDVVAR
jgi:hypothetical protein